MNATLVLLAAGMSTRYGRLKQLEPVGPRGETLMDYGVYDARRAGITRVLLVIREELEEEVQRHVRGRWPEDLEVILHHQHIGDMAGIDPRVSNSPVVGEMVARRRKPWGTAHALLTARDLLDGPFVVLNADDFYGAPAFFQAGELLRELEPPLVPVPSFGLITYTLRDTLSGHGGVSRGVTRVGPDGYLARVEEVLDIREASGGLEGRTVKGDRVELSGLEATSTNFWIFTPALFPLLEAGFAAFLSRAGSKEEFLIPTVVNWAIQEGWARVRAIPTQGRFLGITHPDDRDGVVEGLREMTREGGYPSPLWD